MNPIILPCVLLALSITSLDAAEPQTATATAAGAPMPAKKVSELKFKHESFTFVRIQYSDAGGHAASPAGGGSSLRWSIDYPGADTNFTARFLKETRLKGERDGKVLSLTNAELNRYPFIYIVEGGRLLFNDAEVTSLRRYLLGGGFLMVDDFWGEQEWSSLQAQMKRVFPDREPVDLPLEHPLFHCYYDLQEKPQVPALPHYLAGRTYERLDGKEAHYRGLLDDQGRMMVLFCHNTDLGDGWEREGEDAGYFKEISCKKAYPMGINIVVFALTQ